jgi:predicted RNA-binding protein
MKMCESSVFLMEGGERKKIMNEAVLIRDDGNKIIIIGLMGEKKEIERARIAEVDVDRHEVVLRA